MRIWGDLQKNGRCFVPRRLTLGYWVRGQED